MIKKIFNKNSAALLLFLFFLTSCTGSNMNYVNNNDNKLLIEEFFLGKTVAFGIFEDRFDNLKRQFRVNIVGKKIDNGIILHEDFLYDDGEKDTRIWTFKKNGKDKNDQNIYLGNAKDILGNAIGLAKGNQFNLEYDINLNISGRNLKVHFSDWIYQQNKNVAINRAYVTKFGLKIGSVTLVFLRGDLSKSIGKLDLEKW